MPHDRKTERNHGAAQTTPRRVGPLRRLVDVHSELSRVYRAARIGKLPLDQAKGLGYLLQLLAAILKDASLEARVAALEEELNASPKN